MNLGCAGCMWHRLEVYGWRSESICVGPNDDECEEGEDGKMSHYEEADSCVDGHDAMERRMGE